MWHYIVTSFVVTHTYITFYLSSARCTLRIYSYILRMSIHLQLKHWFLSHLFNFTDLQTSKASLRVFTVHWRMSVVCRDFVYFAVNPKETPCPIFWVIPFPTQNLWWWRFNLGLICFTAASCLAASDLHTAEGHRERETEAKKANVKFILISPQLTGQRPSPRYPN